MSFTTGLRKIPFEAYPIFFMISCALGFGAYVATSKLNYDPDLRLRQDHGQKDWRARLQELSEQNKQQPLKL
eukprot:jgi/Hompol1/2249/HPOL_005902-RA